MALTGRSFSGANFFTDVRAAMNANRGMFAGVDGAFRYVCMDASFYNLEMFIRPPTSKFTDAALTLPANVRVVANGQMFSNYNFVSPGPIPWQGQVIRNGTLQPGSSGNAPKFRHFGQWSGASTPALDGAPGDPSTVSPGYTHAFGRLLPLVENGVPAPAGPLGTMWSEPDDTGKPVYGIVRAAQVVFVLVQKNGDVGLTVPDLINRLVAMKVDDAVLGDGSDSAALLVDRVIEVAPGHIKNLSIPVGPSFRLVSFQLAGARTMTNDPASTDPEFTSVSMAVTNTEGTLQLTNGGMDLNITALGTPSNQTAEQLRDRLGITLPLRISATTSLIAGASPTSFSGNSGNVTADLTLTPKPTDPTADGSLKGKLSFTTARGKAVFNVDWQVGQV